MWTDDQIGAMRAALLDWYDAQGRRLPWRVRPEDRAQGIVADPYAVWLSEVMLQQTTIPHGTPYWHKFLSLYPTVHYLARAPLDDVLTHWAGLGYYARARNLHKCARIVSEDLCGAFPGTKAELLKLPGIGDYTASAIAAICFDKPESVVDGNVERVMARLHTVEIPLPKAKTELKRLAAQLADPERPGDYGQAVMDLGATVCTPRNPSCLLCPWTEWCRAYQKGEPTTYPRKSPKAAKPVRQGWAYVLVKDGAVWMRRRPEEGLLGGMMEVPTSDWGEEHAMVPPVKAGWAVCAAPVRHVFTHFELRLSVAKAEITRDPDIDGRWVASSDFSTVALPSLYRKVLDSAGF